MPVFLTPAQKVVKARATLVMAQPFFGSLALRLKVVEDVGIKKSNCDGVTFAYNPKYIDSLTLEEVRGVLAQAVMHPAFLHHTRRGNREKKKWNKAADYSINGIIERAGFKLPPGEFVDPKYDGTTAEHIYTLLPEEPEGNDPGEGEGEGDKDSNGDGCCGVNDAPGDKPGQQASESERKSQEQEWKLAVAQAAHVAKQQGKLPADMERMIEELMAPQMPWKELLRRFLTEKAADDFTWKRGNRRFVSQGLYLPSRESEATGEIAVCIDTSGSIGAKELNEFGSEIQGIIEEVRPSKTIVIYCDAQVNKVVEFGPHDPVILEAVGGGGTDFRPPFHYLREKNILPKALVYLTDGYGSFPDEHEVDFPTLWCINNDQVVPPLGEHLVLNVD